MTLVLIVDDSPIDRALAKGLLEKQGGYRVACAEDGQAGLNCIRELSPDLILTDMQMPLVNGLEMVSRLQEEGIQIPVILMTATGSEELAVEALRCGASSYVCKRSLARQLVDTARMVLSSAQENRRQVLLMERLRSHVEEFELDNNAEECTALSRHLSTALSAIWNLRPMVSLRICLSLEEALLNALYHGNLEVSSKLKEFADGRFYEQANQRRNELPYCSRRINVTAQMNLNEVRIVIRDGGLGFDVSSLPDPHDPQNMIRPSGRGVMLMRAFMDEILYNECGNQVTLVKGRQKCQ